MDRHPTIVDFEAYCEREQPTLRLRYEDSSDENRTFKSSRIEKLWLVFSAGWDRGWDAADSGELQLPNPVSIWQDFFDECHGAKEIIKGLRDELLRVQQMRAKVLDWATDQEREAGLKQQPARKQKEKHGVSTSDKTTPV